MEYTYRVYYAKDIFEDEDPEIAVIDLSEDEIASCQLLGKLETDKFVRLGNDYVPVSAIRLVSVIKP